MRFILLLFSRLIFCDVWMDQGNIDRAQVLVNTTSFSTNLVLWQNTEECHHCSWIRARDKLGNVIPPLEPNGSYIAWIDTRWPQRFRFALKNSTNTNYEGNNIL